MAFTVSDILSLDVRLLALILFLSFFFFTASPLFAADISFSNNTSTIQKDQEIILDIHLTGAASNTTNYIRAAFYHPDSPTSYFGQVFNHQSSWYNGTPSPINAKQFLEVQINSEGTWSGQLKVKADTQSPYFRGNGAYFLKVGRYTASATSVSNWSASSQIEIQGVLPTATPTLKPTPTEKPTSTPKPAKVTNFHPTTPVVISQAGESEEEFAEEEEETEVDDSNLEVLGVSLEKNDKPSVTPTPLIEVKNSSNTSSIFLISGALIFIIGCGILLVREYRKQKLEEL